MRALAGLPAPLRVYLLAVITTGPAAALLLALLVPEQPGRTDWVRIALLFVMTVAAERFTIHLTHKTEFNLATACYLPAVLTFPLGVPGLFAMAASAVGKTLRPQRDPVEIAFNAAQAGLYTTVAAVAVLGARHLPLGPSLGGIDGVGVIVVAIAVLHLGNTMLVAGAVGLQLGTNVLRVWRSTLRDDGVATGAMAAFGLLASVLLVDQPVLLPLLAVPLILIHWAVREAVQVRTNTHAALASLVEVVELRDPYTAGHSNRVADLARALALRLGRTHEEADVVESAGWVHDLGKVAIDPAILTKADRLTEAEQAAVRRHPIHSARVIARFSAYRSGVPIVRHHHERWDGGGYPDGLAGEAIPLGARILAVADTYDALTSARPYRAAMGTAKALLVLREGAGSQWDPTVVDALLDHVTESQASPSATATPVSPSHSRSFVESPVDGNRRGIPSGI